MQSIDSSLERFFESYRFVSRFVLAYSGGMDSTVLLHAMHRLGLPLYAVHVNHHLQAQSTTWQQHCDSVCKALGIDFAAASAPVQKAPQQSLEECARKVRYRCLFEQVGPQDVLVSAHHQDDLAETLLLQLLRGAGPAGLAAMGADRMQAEGRHLRPLLTHTRAQLSEYATSHSLDWVEDPSNRSSQFDRNYLRLEILPRLVQRWPAAVQTFSRATELQADALQCLHELADQDVQAASTGHAHILDIGFLQHLGAARLKNALRGWIRGQGLQVPGKKMLEHIIEDMVYRKDLDTAPVQTWAAGEVRRYRNSLYLLDPRVAHDPGQVFQWQIDQPLVIKSLNRVLHYSDLEQFNVNVPEGTRELTVQFRKGGERFRPAGQKHHRTLKNLFQEGNIPPWERDRIPLLYHEGELISVLGYWNSAST